MTQQYQNTPRSQCLFTLFLPFCSSCSLAAVVYFSTMSETARLLSIIEAKRDELGISQAQLGQLAFGKADSAVIQNLKRGSSPTFDRLSAIAEALGLELYFGPPRESGMIQTMSMGRGDDYARVPLHGVELAAGQGAANDGEAVISHLAFSCAWLKQMEISASAARLAYVRGDSMAPTLAPGDLVMIDTSRRSIRTRHRSEADRRRSPIYAISEAGEARIKRVERPADDHLILISDNPEFAPEIRHGSELANLTIIGKVVWWGHTATD